MPPPLLLLVRAQNQHFNPSEKKREMQQMQEKILCVSMTKCFCFSHDCFSRLALHASPSGFRNFTPRTNDTRRSLQTQRTAPGAWRETSDNARRKHRIGEPFATFISCWGGRSRRAGRLNNDSGVGDGRSSGAGWGSSQGGREAAAEQGQQEGGGGGDLLLLLLRVALQRSGGGGGFASFWHRDLLRRARNAGGVGDVAEGGGRSGGRDWCRGSLKKRSGEVCRL
ncbi:unnamed protein product [Lampetra planeri]